MSRQPAHGKRRAEPSKRRRRQKEPKPKGGKRAYRPENEEGLTSEFLEQLRQVEAEEETTISFAVRGGPGGRRVLAGIDGYLRADRLYQQALSRLTCG